MKISKQKIFGTLAYFFITFICLLIIVYSQNSQEWLSNLAIIVVIHMIFTFFILKKVQGSIVSLSSLFIIFSYLFHFGQVILIGLFKNYRFVGKNMIFLYSETIYTQTLTNVFLIMSFVILGIILGTKKIDTNSKLGINEEKDRYSLSVSKDLGKIILLLTFPLKLYIDTNKLYLSVKYGYGDVLDFGISNMLVTFANFYIIGFIMLIFAYKKNVKKQNLTILFLLAYNILTMFSGARGDAVTNIVFVCLIIIYIKSFKFRIIDTIKYGLFGVLGLSFLNSIIAFRMSTNKTISRYIYVFFREISNNNPILDAIEEFGSTIYTPLAVTDWVMRSNLYNHGLTYLYSIPTLLPDIGGYIAKFSHLANYGRQLQSIGFSAGYEAIGGSYIGEVLYNFQYFGFLVAVLIGLFVSNISKKLEMHIIHKEYYKIAYYIPISIGVLYWVRSYFVTFLRSSIWGIALIYILLNFILSYKKVRRVNGRE